MRYLFDFMKNLSKIVVLGLIGISASSAVYAGSPTGTLITQTGHVFTDRDDLAQGAWQDPSGMVWYNTSDVPKSFDAANADCEAKGLSLPHLRDFERLRSYMGASEYSHHGFSQQILPYLGNKFWSSSICNAVSFYPPTYVPGIRLAYAYGFDGSSGIISPFRRSDPLFFRCMGQTAVR